MSDSIKTHLLDILKQPSVKTELQIILNYVLDVLFLEISPFIYTIFALIFMIFIMNIIMCTGWLIFYIKKI